MIASVDQYLTFKQVTQSLPTRPHVATVWRWVQRGCRGHKLTVTKIGGRNFVTLSDLENFLRAINGGATTAISSKSRAAELAKVDRDLDRELA